MKRHNSCHVVTQMGKPASTFTTREKPNKQQNLNATGRRRFWIFDHMPHHGT